MNGPYRAFLHSVEVMIFNCSAVRLNVDLKAPNHDSASFSYQLKAVSLSFTWIALLGCGKDYTRKIVIAVTEELSQKRAVDIKDKFVR